MEKKYRRPYTSELDMIYSRLEFIELSCQLINMLPDSQDKLDYIEKVKFIFDEYGVNYMHDISDYLLKP